MGNVFLMVVIAGNWIAMVMRITLMVTGIKAYCAISIIVAIVVIVVDVSILIVVVHVTRFLSRTWSVCL